MQSETEMKDQSLQLISSICSILKIPFYVSPQSINIVFDDKIYYDIICHLHPSLEDYLNQLQTTNNTSCKQKITLEKRLKALIELLSKYIIQENLSHIKVKKIIQKDIHMSFRLIQILYQYTKKKVSKHMMNESSDILSSQEDEEEQNLYRKIMNQEKVKTKKKKQPIKVSTKNKIKSSNKLSESDLVVSRQIMKGLKKVKSQSPKKFIQHRVINEQIQRKKKQLKMKHKQLKSFEQKQQLLRAKSQALHQINEAKKQKSQNVFFKQLQQKQSYLKKTLRSQQKSLELKLRDQKSLYLRRMYFTDQSSNSALLKLQKQKHVEDQKTLRDRINQQNNQLKMQLQAIRTYYRSQMQLTKQCQQQDQKNRILVDRAYKVIASKLQKQLRQNNEKKLQKLKQKHEGELLKWQDEDKIQQQVREIYKKYY